MKIVLFLIVFSTVMICSKLYGQEMDVLRTKKEFEKFYQEKESLFLEKELDSLTFLIHHLQALKIDTAAKKTGTVKGTTGTGTMGTGTTGSGTTGSGTTGSGTTGSGTTGSGTTGTGTTGTGTTGSGTTGSGTTGTGTTGSGTTGSGTTGTGTTGSGTTVSGTTGTGTTGSGTMATGTTGSENKHLSTLRKNREELINLLQEQEEKIENVTEDGGKPKPAPEKKGIQLPRMQSIQSTNPVGVPSSGDGSSGIQGLGGISEIMVRKESPYKYLAEDFHRTISEYVKIHKCGSNFLIALSEYEKNYKNYDYKMIAEIRFNFFEYLKQKCS